MQRYQTGDPVWTSDNRMGTIVAVHENQLCEVIYKENDFSNIATNKLFQFEELKPRIAKDYKSSNLLLSHYLKGQFNFLELSYRHLEFIEICSMFLFCVSHYANKLRSLIKEYAEYVRTRWIAVKYQFYDFITNSIQTGSIWKK